ncbi:hypothetical protein [Humisphaera borealis]|nr:hypothetical protein [Humisphaera borealis]
MIAADPGQGGATWAVLQYVLGLKRLGHEVLLIEPIQRESLQASGGLLQGSRSANYFLDVVRRFGIERTSSLLLADTTQTVGLSHASLVDFAANADLLINVSGMLRDPALTDPVRVTAYLDLDPAFIQMWNAMEGIDMRFDRHSHFITIGQRIGQPDCLVPTCGRSWITTLQPVVLDEWPAIGPDGPIEWQGLTTIANWRGYGSIEHNGQLFGQKVHSVRALIDLPRQTSANLLPAIAIHAGETRDLAALQGNGWNLLDPADVASTPERYQRFIQRSWAEIGIAKSGYVHSRCGWFSDRSACYLASGRPVVAQDTDFAESLPTGEGLLRFATTADAATAIEQIQRDYRRHSLKARQIAQEYFDSNRVLPRLLAELGVT